MSRKRTIMYFLLVVSLPFIVVSTGHSADTFSEKPPSEEQLASMIQVVLDGNVDRFCFEGYSESNLTENAKAIYMSFGESAEITVRSVKIMEVGDYKGYWPIRLNATGTCQLRYRDDFAQHAPAFSKWRGRTITTEIDTIFAVDVREDDFGKLQIRLRD